MGGVLGIACGRLFDRLQIDDVAGAFPVHGVCGQSGTYDQGDGILVSANFGRLVLGCIEADLACKY